MIGRDFYFYKDDISRENAKKLIRVVTDKRKTSKNKVCTLFLITNGGDPDAAYWIAKALQNNYEQVQIAIPSFCKSAGTLIAIGAHTLFFGNYGELGPLDIQLSKDDELIGSTSSLVAKQSLVALIGSATNTFEETMVNIFLQSKGRITTKTAAEIAVNLTGTLFRPIMEQIDPMRVGEHDRSTTIALQYGRRLDAEYENLKDEALEKLIYSYPSHGFVIDYTEASQLFNRVQEFDQNLTSLLETAAKIVQREGDIFALPDVNTKERTNGESVTEITGSRDENDKGVHPEGERLPDVQSEEPKEHEDGRRQQASL